ncbi:hypothetical protein MBLNU459_g1158t1 [Dothideomycetes sp. NU459]
MSRTEASPNGILNICSKRDLTNLCEVFDAETNTLLRSTFTYINKEQVAWFGQALGISKFDLTVDDLKRNLKRIPDEKIYPLPTPRITVAPDTNQELYFIKPPKLLCLDNEYEAELVPPMLIDEAETLEILTQHPHPNLVRYHGCTVRRGRVTGIVLERHRVILQYRHLDDPRPLDIEACMKGIRAGVEHLHQLGFAHNDLNPMNVAFDEDDNPVILDFGSCRRFDEQLVSAGTPGWGHGACISTPKNDESAMEAIEAWLVEKDSESRTKTH